MMTPFIHSFVGVSEEITSWFRDKIPSKANRFCAIQNGVEIERFKPDITARRTRRCEYGITSEEVLIGTCARLEPVKNLQLLLDAFSRCRSLDPRVRLMIIGDGSCRRDLEQRVAELGIGNKVVFAGLQPNIETFLPAFDIYTLTSHDEGLPMSVLEAMSTGLPIVATNVGSLFQVVSHANGILVDEPTPEKIGAALLALVSDPQRRQVMGAMSRSLVIEQYSDSAMVDYYISLLAA